MKDIDRVDNQHITAQSQQVGTQDLTPLYQQFTLNLFALLCAVISIVGLVSILFYQHNIQNNSLVNSQLVPLTQAIEQINTLQKTDKLITDLLQPINADNFVGLHTELVSLNRQLFQQNSLNVQLYQQWLNENILAEDIVSRIQDSHTRNEQVKQSSIIQLQLMLLTISSVIEDNSEYNEQLYIQLKANQGAENVTFVSAKNYAESIKHQENLLQFKGLLESILFGFESLNMHTPMANFESLRLQVEQIFALHQVVSNSEIGQRMVDVNQQFTALEKIIISEQRALAKWQGYIRLAQDYRFKLEAQQTKIQQLLLAPYQLPQDKTKGLIQDALSTFNLDLSDKHIVIALIIAITLSLLLFFYLLWRLRNKIKTSSQQGVSIINKALNSKAEFVAANCVETQVILNQIQRIAQPAHDEDEFQEVSTQLQSTQLLLTQQEQSIEQLTFSIEQLNLDFKGQVAKMLMAERLGYQHLERVLIPIINQQQFNCLHDTEKNNIDKKSLLVPLTLLRKQLVQFQLALAFKSDEWILQLNDINLINELHALVFNKQQEQLKNDNQIFISCDEHLLSKVKLDILVFQQLMSLFLDIALIECRMGKVYFTVQLQDKNAGQQIVHFTVKVKTKAGEVLPSLINQLVNSQSAPEEVSPLIDAFNIFFNKQHGENIVSQLEDEGYQLSFDLPLAIADSTDNMQQITLEKNNVMLASNNSLLTDLIEKTIISAKGKFEKLTRIDSVLQQLNAKRLTQHKLDILVVASDIAINHLSELSEQLNSLPESLQPKLMVLQSAEMAYDRFGFYSQTEQIFCKETFLQNMFELMQSDQPNNHLIKAETLKENQFSATDLPLLLAVRSPQKYQNLQRLIQWLGLNVFVVSHETVQESLWKTGQFCLLITEFIENATQKMTNEPLVEIGVFSLTNDKPCNDESKLLGNWHLGNLNQDSTLTELIDTLSPWLKANSAITDSDETDASHSTFHEYAQEEELHITEIANVYLESDNDTVFDFSKYLQNQGTVELAL